MLNSHTLEGGLKILHKNNKGEVLYEEEPVVSLDNQSNIELLVTDEKGKIESKSSIPFRSFTPNFINMLLRATDVDSGTTIRRITGVTFNNAGYGSILNLVSTHTTNDPIDTVGIVIGTGSVAKNISDYKLGGRISHGTGSGQMFYGESLGDSSFSQTTSSVLPTDTSIYTISRNWVNMSSGTINVREVGLYGSSNFVGFQSMISRDTTDYLGNPISQSIDHGKTFTVSYKLYFDLINGWTKNFGDCLSGHNVRSSTVDYSRTRKDINGTARSLTSDTMLMSKAPEGYINYGGVCGSGSNPTTQNSYKLDSIYSHGTGSNQLFYDRVNIFQDPVTVGNISSGIIYRDIFNYSSSPITVREIGWHTYSNSYTYLINRKVLSEPVTLNPGDSLQIQLIFKAQY